MKNYLKEVLKRKDLLIYLVKSNLKADNRDSYLGYLWWLLDPLLNVVIYYFLVVVLMGRGGPDFPVYLVIGLIVWRWINTTIKGSTKAITRYASVINQVYLPKGIFPIALTTTQLFNFSFGLIVIAIFLMFFGVIPQWQIIFLPLVILVQFLFLLAVSMFISYVCVFIKDIDNLTTHIIRVFFYTSPIIWGDDGNSRLPAALDWLLSINPVAIILNGYRDILMYHRIPNLVSILIMGLVSFIGILYLFNYYSKNEQKIIKSL